MFSCCLDARVDDGFGGTDFLPLNVIINNINDNTPTFPSAVYASNSFFFHILYSFPTVSIKRIKLICNHLHFCIYQIRGHIPRRLASGYVCGSDQCSRHRS